MTRESQLVRQRDKALLRAVVQVALEAAPLDVAGSDDPRTRGGELFDPGAELVVQAVNLRRLRLALCDVGVGDHVAEHATGPVPHGRGRDRDRDERPVLAQTLGLVVVDRLSRPHPREQVLRLRAFRGRRHGKSTAAEHLVARPAEDALRGRVPQPDARVEVELDEGERRRVDQRLQSPSALRSMQLWRGLYGRESTGLERLTERRRRHARRPGLAHWSGGSPDRSRRSPLWGVPWLAWCA